VFGVLSVMGGGNGTGCSVFLQRGLLFSRASLFVCSEVHEKSGLGFLAWNPREATEQK
jgi:hypothetical protein